MSKTKELTLLSGVPAAIRKMDGSHQQKMTENQNPKKAAEAFDEVIADCLEYLGDIQNPTSQHARDLLSSDRAQILMHLRDHTMQRHREFTFELQWRDENGQQHSEPKKFSFDVGDFEQRPYARQFETYDEIWREQKESFNGSFYLEDAEEYVYYNWSTGRDEIAMQSANRSIHYTLQLRNPQVYRTGEEDTYPVQLNLNKCSWDDLEDLREHIVKEEGFMDTGAIIENERGDEQKVNLLNINAFFFPSLGREVS